MELRQIGTIHTPFRESTGTPIQPRFGSEAAGTIEIFPQFAEGLEDLEGFERIWVVWSADRARPSRLKVVPYRDTVERGVFATRAPSRPNSIMISSVCLTGRKGNVLEVRELDMLDGSPVYDIKPYIPAVDSYPDAQAGWFDEVRGGIENADERFEGE